MPPVELYIVFETPAGLEIRPNPIAQAAEKTIQIFKQNMGRMVHLNDGSNFGEYLSGEADTPITIGQVISIPVSGVAVDHITSVGYYTLAGVRSTISDNDVLKAALGAFYGFTNPHADF